MILDIGIRNVFYVGNMVRNADDRAFIEKELEGSTVIGYVSYSEEIHSAVRTGRAPYDVSPALVADVAAIWEAVVRHAGVTADVAPGE